MLLLVFCVLFCFYFLPVLIGVSGLQVPLLPGPGYIKGKNKTQGTHCHVVLQDPGSLASIPLSLHHSEAFDVCFLHIGFRGCV